MTHKHIFKHIGGGCLVTDITNKMACDNDYKCFCGADFRVFTSFAGHKYLPESFEAEEMSEIKSLEQQQIEKALKNNL